MSTSLVLLCHSTTSDSFRPSSPHSLFTCSLLHLSLIYYVSRLGWPGLPLLSLQCSILVVSVYQPRLLLPDSIHVRIESRRTSLGVLLQSVRLSWTPDPELPGVVGLHVGSRTHPACITLRCRDPSRIIVLVPCTGHSHRYGRSDDE